MVGGQVSLTFDMTQGTDTSVEYKNSIFALDEL